jgi:pSer/pThr/pTyr-binding forkhead associated (FHA) protein
VAPAGPSAPISKLILPQGDEISITSYPRTFGRSDFLRVDKSDYISRKHFEISLENGKYYILDVGSTNGTNLNGTKLTGKTELKGGDSIELGGVVTLTFQTT